MDDKKKEFLSQVRSKALLPILNLPSKPTKPEEPSSFQEFYYSFSELINKFIEENDFAKVEHGRFLHAEEFFLWLSKLAASDDLVLRVARNDTDQIEDYDLYLKMDSSQFDHQKQEYEKALVKYEKDLSEYDEKCLTIIDENINNLKNQVDRMIKAREELLKNSEKLKA